MAGWCILLIVLFSVATVNVHGSWTTRSRDTKSAFDHISDKNRNILKEKENTETFSIDGGKKVKSVKFLEGDIVMTPKLNQYLLKTKGNPDGASPFDAITNGAWPKNGAYAYIPYTFARNFAYQRQVKQAIAEYQQKTCIRFRPRTNEQSYIEFMHGGGCYSMIGRQGGRQQVSLGQGCGHKGVAIHEMMHALGFFHEQSRLDRDSQITINWSNIRRSMWYNFEKYKRGQADTLGEAYDKKSIMHYGNYAFSTNGRKTIVSKSNPNERLGQRNELSIIDVNQLKKYYKCPGVTERKTTKRPKVTGCNDKYSICTVLANTARLCSNKWVKVNCKKSCKSCQKPPTKAPKKECKDKNKNCDSWAKYNAHCKYTKGCCHYGNYVRFMKGNCNKACNRC